jgi:hypothetical protein
MVMPLIAGIVIAVFCGGGVGVYGLWRCNAGREAAIKKLQDTGEPLPGKRRYVSPEAVRDKSYRQTVKRFRSMRVGVTRDELSLAPDAPRSRLSGARSSSSSDKPRAMRSLRGAARVELLAASGRALARSSAARIPSFEERAR